MISFTELSGVDIEKLHRALGLTEEEDREYLEEIYSAFSEVSQQMDTEVALCNVGGCLAVRIYDGERYIFPLPIEVRAGADLSLAVREIGVYARHELIPLYFSDVPREALTLLGELFPRIDARAYDTDEDLFGVFVSNECASLREVPSITLGDITLDEIRDGDREAYAALCSDRELNRWWGYDADVDNPERDPDVYLRVARSELESGIALTLAVRKDGEFVGEAVVYDFDYVGGAAIGIRILPAFQGGGIGSRTLMALIALCREIGLSTVRTSVMKANSPSVRMTDKHMTRTDESEDKIFYSLSL